MLREDSGKYNLEISNDSGSAFVAFKLKVKSPPGKPIGPLEISKIGKSSCTLSWKDPIKDGGSRISHYMIEKRDCSKDKNTWIPYADHCKETSINVQGLFENSEYEFRVMAVNSNGISEPLITERSTVVKLPFDVPSAPGVPEVQEIGSNFVTLSWSKASSEGPIIGYWIEKREKGDEKKWIRCNFFLNESTVYNVPYLIENQNYEFRIFAENEAGIGKPSDASKFVEIKDPNAVSLPEFSLKMKDTEAVEGKTASFDCEINSSPMTEVCFYKGSKEIHDGIKYKINNEGCSYKLVIYNVCLDDQEEFSVKAKNRIGSRMSRAFLTVKC